MPSSNYIGNVAIVGAGGNSGSYMTAELLKTGKHSVTALTRVDSPNKFPEGVRVAQIDYDIPGTIVDALKGQDALVMTLSVFADPSQQRTLIKAAGEAGVQWILPNEWAPDSAHEGLAKDVPTFDRLVETQQFIAGNGQNFLAVACGFWYEWSLSIPSAYGFDLNKHEVVFFDDGKTRICTSTWPQVGRAVAALFSLPIQAESSSACLEDYKNKHIYISSFTVNQKDIFESVLRVTGTTEDDWNSSYEPSKSRYENGIRSMRQGDREGFAKAMYTRVFFPDGSGDFETGRGLSNVVLGLPKESLDDATRAAVERARTTTWGGTAARNLK